MPLSNDPQKRARQLQNLSKGGQTAFERHGLRAFPAGHGAQGDPATPLVAGHETAGGEEHKRGQLPVVGYGSGAQDPAFTEPANTAPQATAVPASTPPAVESRAAAGDIDEHEHEPDVDEHEHVDQEEEPDDRGGLGGLLDGLLGR